MSISKEERTYWAIVATVIGAFLVGIGVITTYLVNIVGILIVGTGSIFLVIAPILRFCDYDCPKKEDDENSVDNKAYEKKGEVSNTVTTVQTPTSDTTPAAQKKRDDTQDNDNSTKNSDRLWKELSCSEKAFKLIGILILIFGLSYVICVANQNQNLYGLGIVGLGSFLVVLATAFCLSDKWDLREGEFRKALTISVGAVYFYSLALSDKIYTFNSTSNITGVVANATIPWNATISHTAANATLTTNMTQWTIVEPLFNNLWAVFLLIVGFYFAEKWIDKYRGG